MIVSPTYAEALSDARKENPARKKDDFIDVEFWDAPDEQHQITHEKSEPPKDNGGV